jgi:hypothetical protein
MGVRQLFREKPAAGTAVMVALLALAAVILAHAYWPEKHADLAQAFYTTDDGQHWFSDSEFRVAPFDHDGKPAVKALIYSYNDGRKQFCACLQQFTPEGKDRLERALAEAKQRGQPPGSVTLFHEHDFVQRYLQVKQPGAGHEWISFGDPRASEVLAVHSPDGSAVDQVLNY